MFTNLLSQKKQDSYISTKKAKLKILGKVIHKDNINVIDIPYKFNTIYTSNTNYYMFEYDYTLRILYKIYITSELFISKPTLKKSLYSVYNCIKRLIPFKSIFNKY